MKEGKFGSVGDWGTLLQFMENQVNESRPDTWGHFTGEAAQTIISFGGEILTVRAGLQRLAPKGTKEATLAGVPAA